MGCSPARARVAKVPVLIGIVGWKNSGKTTLVERLIPLLSQRGLKVATVKHTHHDLRPRDGWTDGERHARAGAIQTIVVAPTTWEASGHRQEGAPPRSPTSYTSSTAPTWHSSKDTKVRRSPRSKCGGAPRPPRIP